jgi:hypothetical protein
MLTPVNHLRIDADPGHQLDDVSLRRDVVGPFDLLE